MEAVRAGELFGLRSPKTNEVIREVDARSLWQKILEIRLQTGEPYLIFSDTVNRSMPQHQRELGLKVRQSNLCSEIMLHTGVDHLGKDRTAVCCLSSVNAEKFLEWRDHPTFIEDVMRFLDNVLQDFITRAPGEMDNAVYAAIRERSVGLGLMGFHTFLQAQNVPFESALAKSWNMRLFKHLRRHCDAASRRLAEERGPCPDAAERGVMERFSHKLAIAPTASISIICGGTSAGIEPIPANIYSHKTLSGTFAVRNPYLERLLEEKGLNTPAVWDTILENEGSVQHLEGLSDDEKDVYKTAFEIDQRWIVELAADRTPDICQSQSVNLFLPGDVDKWDLHMLHWMAWERGCKSLYYLRSKSVQRASHAGAAVAAVGIVPAMAPPEEGRTDYEECLACQ
jgi:ribonucleoside-diphosphate reductase alpha chain